MRSRHQPRPSDSLVLAATALFLAGCGPEPSRNGAARTGRSLSPLPASFIEHQRRPCGAEGGFIPEPVRLSPARPPLRLLAGGYPATYDLRTLGKLPPVRDQGGCGACWAFATFGALESYLLPAQSLDFSENHLKNTHGFDGGACGGGNALMAAAYFARLSGPVAEADDPYNPGSSSSPSGLAIRKRVGKVILIPPRTGTSDNDALKAAIMTHGAVWISILFDGASFNNATSAHHYASTAFPATANSNHVVDLVGWDDGFKASAFTAAPPGDGAFIARNSKGAAWGEKGYFYISYHDGVLGKFYSAVFVAVEEPAKGERVYEHDPLGWTQSTGFGTTTASMANVFSAVADERLSAVGLYVASAASSCAIQVYGDVQAGPTSGTLLGSTTVPLAEPGYHTVSLESLAIKLARGKKFSVAAKCATPGNTYPIAIEKPLAGYSSAAAASSGQSYVSADGTTWADLVLTDPGANVCLKAFARPHAAPDGGPGAEPARSDGARRDRGVDTTGDGPTGEAPSEDGCQCRTSGRGASGLWLLVLLLIGARVRPVPGSPRSGPCPDRCPRRSGTTRSARPGSCPHDPAASS